MTPAEVTNPRRRLRALRRQAIDNLAATRANPNPDRDARERELTAAVERVTELQNQSVPEYRVPKFVLSFSDWVQKSRK